MFLASHAYSSRTNPRGWFNDPAMDVIGPGGTERFRKALTEYIDRSLVILRDTHAQGIMVWDLEGEEFPHKTSYIGDPRALDRLAPEMAAAADEFFARFRNAGLRVGVTIRPQQLILSSPAGGAMTAKQENVSDYETLLLEKIDYAAKRWGASIFYLDSNGGVRWPAELLRLRRVAAQRPGVLIIPEHHYLAYGGFSAPYDTLLGRGSVTPGWVRWMNPEAFQVLNICDIGNSDQAAAEVIGNGDIALFRGWFCGPDCTAIQKYWH